MVNSPHTRTDTVHQGSFTPSHIGAIYTASNGAPIFGHPYAAQRVGHNGPLLLQGAISKFNIASIDIPDMSIAFLLDFSLIDSLAHVGML